MLVYSLFLLYLFCVDAKLWYAHLASRMSLREESWIQHSILVLYLLVMFLARASMPLLLAIEVSFAAPFVILDTVSNTYGKSVAPHDPLDCDHSGLHISSLTASIASITTLCNTLTLGPTMLRWMLSALATTYHVLDTTIFCTITIARAMLACGRTLAVLLMPILIACSRVVVDGSARTAAELFELLHDMSDSGTHVMKNYGVSALYFLRCLELTFRSLINKTTPHLSIAQDNFSDLLSVATRTTSTIVSHLASALSLFLGHLSIFVGRNARETVSFVQSNFTTAHYLILLRLLVWAASASKHSTIRRQTRISGFILDIIVVSAKVYTSFGTRIALVFWYLTVLSSNVIHSLADFCASSLLLCKPFLNNLFDYCIRAAFDVSGPLVAVLLPLSFHYVFTLSIPILSKKTDEIASVACSHLFKKIIPNSVTRISPMLLSSKKSSICSRQSEDPDFTSTTTRNTQSVTMSFATVLRPPIFSGRSHSLVVESSTNTLSFCKDYFKAGYCSAAIAPKFIECGSYLREMISMSSYSEDSGTQTLENKLLELVALEDQNRRHAETVFDEKLEKLRHLSTEGNLFSLLQKDSELLEGSDDSDSDFDEDFRLSYSLPLLHDIFDMRIKLAQMDVELGNTSLRLAADKIHYASDCAQDEKKYRPACADDIDLYDFLALGDVHEEDVIMRSIVTQKKNEIFDPFLYSLTYKRVRRRPGMVRSSSTSSSFSSDASGVYVSDIGV